MWDAVLEALLDTLKALPFLLGAYLLIEYIEARGKAPAKSLKKYGVPAGALLGLIPQCGFSVTAAKLYSRGVITLGTLFAVFISTSDEALPVMLAYPRHIGKLLLLIAAKLAAALLIGILADAAIGKKTAGDIESSIMAKSQTASETSAKRIFFQAVSRTLPVFLLLFGITLLFNIAVYFLGEERISVMLMSNEPFQAALTALFGLIPNCAPSVILTRLYISGGISFGSLFGGLMTAAGFGPLMLISAQKNRKRALLIISVLYAAGAALGVLINLIFG